MGAAVEDSLVAAGERRGREYGIVEDYVGHGIGTEMHMDPQVPNYRVSGRGPRVVSGTTIAIEPMVTLGDQANRVLDDEWTVVTLDGARAAHWEHTVAVTEEGLWVLTAVDGGAGPAGGRGRGIRPSRLTVRPGAHWSPPAPGPRAGGAGTVGEVSAARSRRRSAAPCGFARVDWAARKAGGAARRGPKEQG